MPDRAANGTVRGWPEPERLRLALDAASDAFFEVDVGAGTISWSRGMLLLFGHDPERRGNALSAWQSLIHPDDSPELLASGAALFPSGAPTWSREFRFARADGTYAPVRARSFVIREGGRPTHVIGALSDLSEIRQRETEIQELHDELARALEEAREERTRADLIMRAAGAEVLGDWDLATNATRWSPNVIDLLGIPANEIRDLDSAVRHLDPRDGPGALADLRHAIETGAESWSGTTTWIRPDGRSVALIAKAYIVRDPSGRALRAVGSLAPAPQGYTKPVPLLSERQRQVLRMVRGGKSNKEIATAIGTSEQGAKAQVSKLLRKFGAGNRASLVAAADELGIGD